MSPDALPQPASTQKCPIPFTVPKSEEKSPLPGFAGSEIGPYTTTRKPVGQCHGSNNINGVENHQCNMAASPFTFNALASGKSSFCATALKSSGNGSRSAEHNNMRTNRTCLLSRACEKLQKCQSPRILRKAECHQNINQMSPSITTSAAEPIVLPQELSQRLDNVSSMPQSRLSQPQSASMILVDIRPFLAFSRRHISGALNVNCATRFSCRRLREGKLSLIDLVTSEEGKIEFQRRLDRGKEVVVYDEDTQGVDNLPNNHPTFLVMRALTKEGVNVRLLKGGIKEFVNHSEGMCVSDLTNANTITSAAPTSPTVINDGEEPPSPTSDSEHILRGGSGICPSEGIPMTQILPHLYVGNEVDAANLDELRLHGISYVLNVTNAVPCFHEGESAMRYKRIPVRDNGLIDLRMHFHSASEFIEEARRRNARVLVHCHAGISRSSTVVIAYVMKHMNQPMSQAYQFVKSKRPIIAPNLGFVGQLMEFEQVLNKMNASSRSAGCRIVDSPTNCAKQLHHSRPGTPSMELDTALLEA